MSFCIREHGFPGQCVRPHLENVLFASFLSEIDAFACQMTERTGGDACEACCRVCFGGENVVRYGKQQ